MCFTTQFVFLVAPCCSQRATLQVTLRCHPSGGLSIHGRSSAPPPTPKLPPSQTWFLGSSGNFKQLLFLEKKIDTHLKNFFHPKFFFIYNFFHPKFFFIHFFFISKKIFPLSLCHAFLDVSCYPECSKKISPQFVLSPKKLWVKQSATQCYQAF